MRARYGWIPALVITALLGACSDGGVDAGESSKSTAAPGAVASGAAPETPEKEIELRKVKVGQTVSSGIIYDIGNTYPTVVVDTSHHCWVRLSDAWTEGVGNYTELQLTRRADGFYFVQPPSEKIVAFYDPPAVGDKDYVPVKNCANPASSTATGSVLSESYRYHTVGQDLKSDGSGWVQQFDETVGVESVLVSKPGGRCAMSPNARLDPESPSAYRGYYHVSWSGGEYRIDNPARENERDVLNDYPSLDDVLGRWLPATCPGGAS